MLAFPRNPKKEKVATPQEERIFTPLTRKVRLEVERGGMRKGDVTAISVFLRPLGRRRSMGISGRNCGALAPSPGWKWKKLRSSRVNRPKMDERVPPSPFGHVWLVGDNLR